MFKNEIERNNFSSEILFSKIRNMHFYLKKSNFEIFEIFFFILFFQSIERHPKMKSSEKPFFFGKICSKNMKQERSLQKYFLKTSNFEKFLENIIKNFKKFKKKSPKSLILLIIFKIKFRKIVNFLLNLSKRKSIWKIFLKKFQCQIDLQKKHKTTTIK